jgi:hypothetical protein
MFENRAITKKGFLLGQHSVRNSNVHPVFFHDHALICQLEGLSGTEFLSSIEQFDKSSASWNVPLQRDWRIINHVLNSPRYEMAVASIPISRVGVSLVFFK